MMPGTKEPIPLDIFHRILSFVPSTDTHTLATLLRLDKASSVAVAPKLYTHPRITPDADLLVDTGLPISILYASDYDTSVKEVLEGNEQQLEQDKEVEVEIGDSAKMVLQHGQTLKAHLLSLIRTIDIHHCSRPAERPSEFISTVPWQHRSVPLSHLDQVTIHLDTSHPSRMSPFANSLHLARQIDPACISLLKTVRPRRVIIKGASFTMIALPYLELPLGLFESVEEIVIVITAGAIPDSGFTGNEYGPSDFYLALVSGGHHVPPLASAPLPRLTTITFLLETAKPADRFRVLYRPHSGVPMTMEYHPDYAPGYVNPLTMLLARNISLDWSKAIVEGVPEEQRDKRRQVNFVNFGSLDGEEFGMPQAAKEEVEDRFRRGMDIRMKQNVSRMRTFNNMEIGDSWKDAVRVMGMKEWLDEDKGRKGVLDNTVLKGWS